MDRVLVTGANGQLAAFIVQAFADREVIALANSLSDHVKLNVLDEKHVLKRVARGLVPDVILERPKQPYRAPDAPSFFGAHAPSWVDEVTSPSAITRAGVFEPKAVEPLLTKSRNRDPQTPFSNTDNMAIVGLLSTQLLHHHVGPGYARPEPVANIKTVVER